MSPDPRGCSQSGGSCFSRTNGEGGGLGCPQRPPGPLMGCEPQSGGTQGARAASEPQGARDTRARPALRARGPSRPPHLRARPLRAARGAALPLGRREDPPEGLRDQLSVGPLYCACHTSKRPLVCRQSPEVFKRILLYLPF